ncbi:two-component system sensor histidine kinase UhpB [Duganella sp. 1224]|uniref:sensor histidine kinase n=1 Tax=Duganella sp. 1224 TaxID=2587052 RepID=UPI0015CD37BC|nr:sensor histidine kinase [Duganella sp. 1224]NYE58966.1 two-component system sensor histidine kinase UhpB [Duganella sp. 1224]
MRRWSWRHWSVRARLMAITALPLAYLFSTFVWYAYQSRLAEVREEMAERGPLVAKVLADSSEFSLIAHRYDDLKLTINGLLRADPSIQRIDVLDAQRRDLVHAAARAVASGELRYYEAPILKRLTWVSVLGPDGKPYQTDRPAASGMTVGTIGHVRVTMSPSALLLKQTRRFYVELLVGSIGLLACVLLAWQLAKGLDASLQASMRALREADDEKRRLIRKVNTAVEDERQSIALEIHDELNATLIAVRLEAQRIAAISPQGEARDKAQSIITLALGLYNSGRALVRRLRPEVLDMLGLDGAVEEMVRHYDAAQSGCRFDFEASGDFSRVEAGIAISAYRIVQEALSNIVKHARATHASLRLAVEQGELRMQVSDNGAGFDPAEASAGIGLVGMRERVYAVNGRVSIDTGLTAGTRINIAMPIR